MVYLDYAANTPVDRDVLNYYYDVSLKYYGNPNSSHKMGVMAKEKIDDSTKKIASLLNVLPEEIIYTSGATEANNLAIKGICERYKNYGKHIIVSSLEHNSIISSLTVMQEEGFDVELAPVTKEGLVDVSEIKKMIRDDTILVSVCSVDSEIGLVQPIEEIGKLLKEYPHIFFHTDATQAIGKVFIDYTDVDLITIAPHKFYGINGIGILVKKKGVYLKPIIHGGRSTTVFRSGTPVLPAIASSSLALEIALSSLDERYLYVKKLYDHLIQYFSDFPSVHINNTDRSIPFTINISVLGVSSKKIVDWLNERDIYVSAKTSCCPLETPSKLVFALTRDKKLASSSVRISLSHLTSWEELSIFKDEFSSFMKELGDNGKI